jgi:hypothetical protein
MMNTLIFFDGKYRCNKKIACSKFDVRCGEIDRKTLIKQINANSHKSDSITYQKNDNKFEF